MNREMLMLVDALSMEKNVAKNIVFGALEMALASATSWLNAAAICEASMATGGGAGAGASAAANGS